MGATAVKLAKVFLAAIIFAIWTLVALKFVYPYDRALSEVSREQKFVFLYDEQRLAAANEINENVLKSDRRWKYGLENNFEVLEVRFAVNKLVYFLTTA